MSACRATHAAELAELAVEVAVAGNDRAAAGSAEQELLARVASVAISEQEILAGVASVAISVPTMGSPAAVAAQANTVPTVRSPAAVAAEAKTVQAALVDTLGTQIDEVRNDVEERAGADWGDEEEAAGFVECAPEDGEIAMWREDATL